MEQGKEEDMSTKRFDQECFEENDVVVREAVKRYFSCGPLQCVDGDKYGVDLVLKSANGFVWNMLELERRPEWVEGEFPYDTIHVPERKRKFNNFVYIAANRDVTMAYLIHENVIKTSPVVVEDNVHCRNEKFFDVPRRNGFLITLS